ncbi:MAG: anthranilate phosphoribosyltransferase [Pseudopedobacter saltans]|uniref:Anthranilate phosphoribosyltransferase n=1 Tax=Pseudopedobacter saltans TaxID=151895 RepID=A0A2W5GNP4_9SPHI|nr:MAG: anthranilate phosphoribosyltransferase [Pseudopedobacter saltans]
MKEILHALFAYKILTREQAKDILIRISKGEFSDYEITAFMTAMRMRSLSTDELEGFVDALLELAVNVDLGTNDVIDIVGTGGDGKNTFNISTLSSFVVAGAGQKVVKQGNYAATSVSGSSDVLQNMGYKFKNDSVLLKKELEEAGICFLHAPLFHPALKSVAPIRKQLGFRTFFNLLGPLVNPARPQYQLLGVYNMEAERLYNYYLQRSGKRFAVVFSLDGYDEISLTGDTKITTNKGEEILTPLELGRRKVLEQDIYGGETAQMAADIFRNIISGKGTEAQNAVVLANSAMALFCTGKYGSFDDAFEVATESLKTGKAEKVLNTLIGLQ